MESQQGEQEEIIPTGKKKDKIISEIAVLHIYLTDLSCSTGVIGLSATTTTSASIAGSVKQQEPMTRSLQLYCVRVTAFSQTDLFLD